MFKYKDFGQQYFSGTIMGEATIIPRSHKTKRNQKKFQDRPTLFLFL
jgi:hypothetical protein